MKNSFINLVSWGSTPLFVLIAILYPCVVGIIISSILMLGLFFFIGFLVKDLIRQTNEK